MYILGINAYHGDSSAAIYKDGELIAATEEERIRRLKHWAGLPTEAIKFCLDEAGITLKEVDYILCEDTRVTGNLLKHYEIATKTRRYDAHASEKSHEGILRDLSEGKHIALVSDAGTPGVSDPGVMLVQRARDAGVRIDAIPGASAVTAAFSIAGISGNSLSS